MLRYAIIVEFDVKPQFRARFLELIRGGAEITRASEPDCLQFEVVESEQDPSTILLFEVYCSVAAREAHGVDPRRAETAARYDGWINGRRKYMALIP
jgi:quinol monooxygenase YgiN